MDVVIDQVVERFFELLGHQLGPRLVLGPDDLASLKGGLRGLLEELVSNIQVQLAVPASEDAAAPVEPEV